MEMLFERDALYEAIHAVSGAISGRSPRPALQCIHVVAAEGKVVFSATDLNIAIRRSVIPKKLKSEGTGLVVGTKLDGLLREALEDEVLLKVDAGEAALRAGRSQFRLLTQEVSDYPELPEFPVAAVGLSGADIDELVRRTVFATAEEGGRYAIDGVSMFVEKGKIELAATDGRRLAVAWKEVETRKAKLERCVVPKDILSRVRSLASSAEIVELAVDRGRLLARAGGLLIAGALIEGTFPAYMDMVPKEKGRPVEVSAAEFASKLRQAAQLTTRDSNVVRFHIESGRIVVEAKSAAVGEGSIEMDATYDGDPVDIAFNPQFLLQAMGEHGEDRFVMEISSGGSPAVVRREGSIYVVAPVRVKG